MRQVILLIAMLLVGKLFAQESYWQQVSADTTSHAYDIAYSETLNLAIPTCTFINTEGDNYLAGFNGEEWITISANTNSGSIYSIVDFDNGILLGAMVQAFVNGVNIPHAAYFDGSTWSHPWTFNGGVRKFKWLNDELYAIGNFSEINDQEALYVARLVDGNWEGLLDPLPNDPGNFYLFHDIAMYQGELYVSGNFWQVDGPNYFAKIQDGALHYVVDEANNTLWPPIGVMEVFQGELYLAGAFNMSVGHIANALVKWNGNEVSTVGGTISYTSSEPWMGGSIVSMKQNAGLLYIAGSFRYIGGEPIHLVAHWNGEQWCGLQADDFDTVNLKTMGFFEDQVMILSPQTNDIYEYPRFWLYTGGDAVSNCTEPLSTSAHNHANELTLHPNPAHTHTTLTSAQQPMERLALYDLQGRLVHEAQPDALSYHIPLAGLPAGMYVLQVQVGSHVVRKKVVVE